MHIELCPIHLDWNKHMEVNYPQTIIKKSDGSNASEAYLSRLCNETFFTLWSYPNIYRDQGRIKNANGVKKGDGKELCDLLAIFDNHIYIFSDKDCSFPKNGDVNIDWARWYKKTIEDAANQIYGAERWLFKFPKAIYMDKACENPLPIPIPDKEEAIVHRIVIAHGASEICKKHFNGGSGSIILCNEILGKQHYDNSSFEVKPFWVGQICPEKGFVHVFDDVSLEIVMQSLDTVSDFSEYLSKKEALFCGPKKIMATGEEEILAYYLTNADDDGNKGFNFLESHERQAICFAEGCWNDFCHSEKRRKQIDINKVSYFWDALIEKFLFHMVTGTLDYMSEPNINSQEQIFKFLARENRLNRRILSHAFIDFMKQTDENMMATRVVLPSSHNSPAFLFFLCPYLPETGTYQKYRETRRVLLNNHVIILKKQYPYLKDIIGIATETKESEHSEDIIHLDAHNWSQQEYAQAEELEKQMIKEGVLNIRKMKRVGIQEFPKKDMKIKSSPISGKERNMPCPCGSGKKFKRCCWPKT